MGVVPAGGRGEKQRSAAACASFCFQLRDERAPNALALMRRVDDERGELRSRALVLEGGGDVELSETHDGAVTFGDDNTVADDLETLQPRGKRSSVCRIAELTE